jgi:hypothetical protein
VKGRTVPPTVSPEELPSRAAELKIELTPYDAFEVPTSAAELKIDLKTYDNSSSD